MDVLPRIALTIGDPAGIGPEILVKALRDKLVREWCRPLLVGPRALFEIHAESSLQLEEVGSPDKAVWRGDIIPVWNPTTARVSSIRIGTPDETTGRVAYDCLVGATRAALRRDIDAICTAPLSKKALHLAGYHFPGHTEILAAECGVADHAMMLYLPADEPGSPSLPGVLRTTPLAVAHTTLHTSIRSVPELLTTERIRATGQLIHDFLRRVDIPRPRIAVCALNPHAGEDGLFGDEEARLISPAVVQLQQQGVQAHGPFPADTLLRRAIQGEFEGVVAMYHDQGHIALKLVAFDRAVNITLGLPIIRTSPSHGTAFDIAGKGTARAEGLIESIRIAAKLATTAKHCSSD